jgi:hypothetical protein
VRVEGVGLAVVPSVEQAHSGGQLGRHVEHLLTGLDQPLRQRATGAIGALDAHTRFGHARTYLRIAA